VLTFILILAGSHTALGSILQASLKALYTFHGAVNA